MDKFHILFPPGHRRHLFLSVPSIIIIVAPIGSAGFSSSIGIIDQFFKYINKDWFAGFMALVPIACMKIFNNIKPSLFKEREETFKTCFHVAIDVAAVIDDDIKRALNVANFFKKCLVRLVSLQNMYSVFFKLL